MEAWILESLIGGREEEIDGMIPHDVMIHEKPHQDAKKGSHSGYYPGRK